MLHLAALSILVATPSELPPVDVEVDSPAAPLAAGNASVVEPDRLAESGETLAEVLSELPGLHLRRAGSLGGYQSLSIRGLEGPNVAVVVDDVPLTSASLGPVDLGLIPLGDIERVEVYRGAGPVRWGSPLGGVVRIVTRPPSDAWSGFVQGTYGAWLTRGLLAHGRGRIGPLSAAATAGYQGSAGDFPYRDDRGTYANADDDRDRHRRNNQFDQAHARLTLAGDALLGATWKLLAAGRTHRQGIPGAGVATTYDASAAETEGLVRLGLDGAELADGDVSLGGGADYLYTQRRFADPRREIGLQVGDVTTRVRRAGADLRALVLAGAVHETELAPRVALEELRQRGQSNVVGERDLERYRRELGLGIEHRADVAPDLRLVLAARAERVFDTGDATTSDEALSPRAAIVTYADPCELHTSVGRFHRFPTTLERLGDGVSSTANPGLAAERGLAFDLGGECRGRPHRIDTAVGLAAFATRAQGLIVVLPTSQFFLRAENLGDTDILGLETHGRARTALVGGDISYTLTEARDDTEVLGFAGNQAPGIPRHRAIAGLELGPRFAFLRYEAAWTSEVQLNRANLQPAPARLIHDLAARFVWEPAALEVWGAVTNVTNVLQQEAPLGDATGSSGVASVRDFTGYPLPGRGWSLTMRWRMS